MKVLYVVNNYFTKGNGLTGSARRTVKKLKEAGLDVQVLSASNPEKGGPEPEFMLGHYKFPVFEGIIHKQGYGFASADKDVIEKAVKWADVIHLEEPFHLQRVTCKIAAKLGKPIVGTYHLHPENLFASIHNEYNPVLNDPIMRLWRNKAFNKCRILQCPTQNVIDRLKKWNYKSDLRLISNGLILEDLVRKEDVEPVKVSDAKYTVMSICRYSVEKDLKTLLNAMKYSAYAKDIQLVLAGQGPEEKKLKKIANKLVKKGYVKYPPLFKFFYNLEELQRVTAGADIYVHCAFIEVEGLSCMEAVQMGIVPIIAKGKYTATSQ
ncbi:MAG: glycosyltransferase, partial [Clostridia bacterium]|nr:glycosyltransferase [Clostridia bacterium]